MTGKVEKTFNHIQSAHCENGVTTSLLRYHGVDFMTEPLAFGLGSGLFYIHIPFLNFNNGPAISFRTMPGAIFKRTCDALGVKVERQKFKSEEESLRVLNQKVSENVPVGCQVGVFHLTYFPKEYRFHFNAHNLIIFGKEGDDYLVSDPVMEVTTTLSEKDLQRVRFAKGVYAPKGHLYYPSNVGEVSPDLLRKGIRKGIQRNTRDMLRIPGGVAGVKGIKYTAKKVRGWREKLGERKAGLYLGQIVRMQEEIGTGGGGFRFLYAAFLEQASNYINNDQLLSVSEDFTKSGDLWRGAAVQMAGIYKGRLSEQKDYDQAADMLIEISEVEKEAFRRLSKLNLK